MDFREFGTQRNSNRLVSSSTKRHEREQRGQKETISAHNSAAMIANNQRFVDDWNRSQLSAKSPM
jgi:hypothetical protein